MVTSLLVEIIERITPKYHTYISLYARTNGVLEPIAFVLAYSLCINLLLLPEIEARFLGHRIHNFVMISIKYSG
jgi:hypothetical protein